MSVPLLTFQLHSKYAENEAVTERRIILYYEYNSPWHNDKHNGEIW